MQPNQANPILDAAPGIYFMFDAAGRFVGWNRVGLETFGLTSDDLARLRPLDVVPPDQAERVSQAIARILAGDSVTMELDLLAAAGERRTFYGTGLPMEHDGQRYVTGLLVDITDRKQAEAKLQRSHAILACVSRLLSLYVGDSDTHTVFDAALTDILRLTDSQFGFIAELEHEADGSPYLQSRAISNIAWDEASRLFYNQHAPAGFRFSALDSLAAAAVVSGGPVIANDPASDPRSSGRLPDGHPALNAFLSLPLGRGGEILGSIALANRPGGYDAALVAELHPVVEACAQLMAACRGARARRQAEAALSMYERMVSCMPDHLSVIDQNYRYLAVNDTYLQHHGLARPAILGHSVADLFGQAVFDTLVKEKLDRCLAGELVQYRDWFDFAATGPRFMDVTYTPYQVDDGRITGVIVASRDITDLERSHQSLIEAEGRFHLMVDQAADALYIADLQGRFVDVNQRACDTLGYTRDELLRMGVLDVELDFEQADALAFWAGLQPGQLVTIRGRHRRRDGSVFPAEIRISALDLKGQRLIVALARDISERLQAEEKLRQAAVVFENAQEGIVVTDREARILAVNQAFCDITGYDEAEVIGATPAKFKSGRHDAGFYKAMWHDLIETGRWQGEVWDRRRNGELFPKWLSISAVRDASGQTVRYVSLFADITHLKESEARLEHLAHFDPLTELPNRLLFNSRLEHAVEQARRHDQRIALLFLDLDRFKTVNDSLGHPAGDELLIAVARRIRKRLRLEDTLARLGGDEFVILLEQLEEAQTAAVVADDLLQVLGAPIQLSGGHEVFIGASIGISLFPDDAGNATRLVSSADAALYHAKEQGRNTYCFYTDALTTAANEHLALETRLRRALERSEFVLHYQPLIDIRTGQPVGVEALVRWQPPGEDLVPPGLFIPIAEETGLIVPLGQWILRAACAQARAWLDAGLPPLLMAVNLSGRQFQSADMVELVRTVLADTGLPARYLELELTESVVMGQAEQSIATLDALKALGVRLAIDDFGTGYSSLAYLKRFPIDKLKIDQSFVQGLADDADDREIATTIIAMARSLKLEVLAEGVETEQQLDILRSLGCAAYQGFLFSRPVSAEALPSLLAH